MFAEVGNAERFEELARRIRNGERNVAQSILDTQRLEDIDSESAIDLIYREFLVLQQLGESLEVSEYCARFPAYATRLQRLLEVDQEFNSLSDTGCEQIFCVGANTSDTMELPLAHIGKSIGRYELIHQIGHGGTSHVYKARQIGLDRIVAVKLLRNSVVDPQTERRFKQEAELIAQLQHPNIVQLFDFGCEEGQLFLSLELVDGGSLDQRIEGALTFDEITELMIRLARAVQYAHEQNIIHRDLKPSNVLLTNTGEPKITDFGLARYLERPGSVDATRTGTMLGTPSYMAPEQIVGSDSSTKSTVDVYGLGAVLYQLLTGRPPFIADNVLETLRLVREEDPVAPARLRPGLPIDLEVICLRCLEKEPVKRFATASDLVHELERFRSGIPILSRSTGKFEKIVRWCRRNPLIAGLCGALIISISAGFTGIMWQWQVAKRQSVIAEEKRQQSQENLNQARQAIDRLTDLSRELSTTPNTDEIREQALREVLAFYLGQVKRQHDPDSALAAARTYTRIAEIRADLRNHSDAIEALTDARAILAELDEAYPRSMLYQHQLAKNWFLSGVYLRVLGQPEEAAGCHLESARLYELCWKASGNRQYQIQQASALNNACGAVVQMGDTQRALELNDQSIGIFESYTDEPDASLLVNRALGYEAKANLLVNENDMRAAIPWYDRALEDLQLAESLGFDCAEDILYTARIHDKAGWTHVQLGSEKEIWDRHGKPAMDIHRERWTSRPDRPVLANEFARASWQWARLLWFVGGKRDSRSNVWRRNPNVAGHQGAVP